MSEDPNLPANLSKHVQKLGKPVTSDDVDSYAKLQEVRDESHRLRTVIRAWKEQQSQDRRMRERYANLLLWGMGIQTLFVNVMFVLIGCRLLTLEQWTAQIFIVSVFAEITALVLLVTKYLFRGTDDSSLTRELRPHKGKRDEQH